MKFNIGCGHRNFGKEWIHIDGENYDHIDSSDIFIKDYQDKISKLPNREAASSIVYRCWEMLFS